MPSIKLQFDTKSLEFKLKDLSRKLQAKVANETSRIAREVYAHGLKLMSKNVRKSMRAAYEQAYHFSSETQTQFKITLNPVANVIEDGFGSFDMAPGFFKNASAVKKSVEGKLYRRVPVEKYTGQPSGLPKIPTTQENQFTNIADIRRVVDDLKNRKPKKVITITKDKPFIHPGLKGARIFPDLNQYAEKLIKNMITKLRLD